MHDDDDFEHEHYGLPDLGDSSIRREVIQQLTLSIDVGTATSKLAFSRIHLERVGQMHNTHYQVVLREVLFKPDVMPTPYRARAELDAERLARIVGQTYDQAGIDPNEIESGAVILSGSASQAENAPAIANALAGSTGRLICVTAGPNLKAVLAAHGSGAVSMSRLRHSTMLNIDVGAATTSLALVYDGEIAGTAGLAIGSRSAGDVAAACDALTEVVAMAAPGGQDHHHHHGLSDAAEDLLLTGPLHAHRPVDAITFSGGVAEYIYQREDRAFDDDNGLALAAAINDRVDALPAPVEPAREGICAAVIGASHLTEQVAGRSIDVSRPEMLPLRRLRVVRPRLPRREAVGAGEMAQAIRRAHERLDLSPGQQAVALAIGWEGEPSPSILRDMAEGIIEGLQGSATSGAPLVLVFDHDYGGGVYKALREDLGVANDLVCIGGLELSDFDVIDVAEAADLHEAVPVAVKVMGMARSGWIFPAIEGR